MHPGRASSILNVGQMICFLFQFDQIEVRTILLRLSVLLLVVHCNFWKRKQPVNCENEREIEFLTMLLKNSSEEKQQFSRKA